MGTYSALDVLIYFTKKEAMKYRSINEQDNADALGSEYIEKINTLFQKCNRLMEICVSELDEIEKIGFKLISD